MKKMAVSSGAIAGATALVLAVGAFEYLSNNRRGIVVETVPVTATIMEKPAVGQTPGSRTAPQGVPGTGATYTGPVAQHGQSAAGGDASSPISARRIEFKSRPDTVPIHEAANRATLAIALSEASRLHPIHPAPVIRRIDENRCEVIAPGSLDFTQGGVTRVAGAIFPCPTIGLARERWGAGTDKWVECSACDPPRQIQIGVAREIVVGYPDGSTESISEVWP